jgi:hypothetical protein
MWKLGEKGEKAKKSQGLSCPMEDMEGTDHGGCGSDHDPSHNHGRSSEEPRTELSDAIGHFV